MDKLLEQEINKEFNENNEKSTRWPYRELAVGVPTVKVRSPIHP